MVSFLKFSLQIQVVVEIARAAKKAALLMAVTLSQAHLQGLRRTEKGRGLRDSNEDEEFKKVVQDKNHRPLDNVLIWHFFCCRN